MREGETEATTTDQLPPDEEGQGSTPDSIAGAVDVDDAAAASVQDQKDEDKEPLSFVNQGEKESPLLVCFSATHFGGYKLSGCLLSVKRIVRICVPRVVTAMIVISEYIALPQNCPSDVIDP